MQTTNNLILPRLVRHLMWNASFIENPGLLNGKMGITIFFYHYAQYTQNRIYEKFAGNLLDEIYLETHMDTTKNFQDGLCGIAWGIEYLIRNNFVKADPDDILEDIDARIMEWDVRYIKDQKLETGLKGIARYAISRCYNRKDKNNILLQSGYIYDLLIALEKLPDSDNEKEELMHKLRDISDKKEIIENMDILKKLSSKCKFQEKTIFTQRPFGILKNGYTAIAFKLLN
ncbi:MAG: hypothetical protein LUE98_19515 [Tannerellaceae bacterium]|nr:hypothetical protein [Tannerellaceae bacterium]